SRGGYVGLEEGVDGRKPVLELVDDAHHAQRAVLAELDEARVDVALEQEVAVLLAAVLVHAAAAVPARLVAQVERVVLGAVLQIEHLGGEIGMTLPRTALRAVRRELFGDDAHRDAS